MKFGKEFQQILDDSKFPADWKSSAIEYRQLKKLIKDVVSELSSMGLSPDVLHRLLTTEDENTSGASSSGPQMPARIPSAVNAGGGVGVDGDGIPVAGPSSQARPAHLHAQHEGDDEVLEFEFDSDEASPPTFRQGQMLGPEQGRSERKGEAREAYVEGTNTSMDRGKAGSSIMKIATGGRRADPGIADDGNEGDNEGGAVSGRNCASLGGSLGVDVHTTPETAARRASSFSRTRNFRVRLLSDSNPANSSHSQYPSPATSPNSPFYIPAAQHTEYFQPHSRSRTEPTPVRPIGVADMMRTQGGVDDDLAVSFGSQTGGFLGSASGGLLRRPSSAEGQHGWSDTNNNGHGHGHRRTVRRSMNEGGIRAQYVFAGDSSHPEPQLRFHLPPSSRSRSISPSGPSETVTSDSTTTDEEADHDHATSAEYHDAEEDVEELKTLPIPAPINLRSRRPGSLANSPATIKGNGSGSGTYASGSKSPFLASVPAISISSPTLPASPTLQRLNMVKSPIFALASKAGGAGSPGMGRGYGSPKVEGLRDLSLGEAAVSDADAGPEGDDGHQGDREDRYAISLAALSIEGGDGEESQACTPDCPANPASPTRGASLALPRRGATASEAYTSDNSSTPPQQHSVTPAPPLQPSQPQHNHPHTNGDGGRDIIVPLTSDRAFFDLLTAALTSLSVFHAAQQEAFRAAVEHLCVMISNSIVPHGSSVQIMPIPIPGYRHALIAPTSPSSSSSNRELIPSSPFRSSPGHLHGIQRPPQDVLARRITKLHKKDLYAWREIFTLWIEAEIFESSAERTRGERTVEEAEARLQAFANEVVKRGLGDRRTFRGKKTREAWEEFLRLNVLLLDLKRFQLANINAARKWVFKYDPSTRILKKHDKRTALTASTGFQTLARATLSKIGADGSVSTWTFYNTSLPHVLLASLTDILLPILPSLDDYACLICTSIAFKPIRLSCQHLFCVRCLVKMQRKGQAECPLCRSPTVLLADKSSLDTQIMDFMRDWFPREVKAKQRENDEEIAEEIRNEERGESADCVVM